MDSKIKFSIQLPASLVAKLDEEAAKSKRNRTQQIEWITENYFTTLAGVGQTKTVRYSTPRKVS